MTAGVHRAADAEATWRDGHGPTNARPSLGVAARASPVGTPVCGGPVGGKGKGDGGRRACEGSTIMTGSPDSLKSRWSRAV
jgi:hypothetical protein